MLGYIWKEKNIQLKGPRLLSDRQLARWVTDFSEQVLIPLGFIRKLLKQFIRNEAENYIMQKGSLSDQSWDNFSFSYPFVLSTLTNGERLSVFLTFITELCGVVSHCLISVSGN